jgi:hypothetical protein
VNNTIAGGGVIHLTSFDNQSKGLVDANQSEGNSLQIIASTFSNEGVLRAESRSELNLGRDGSNATLKNSGTINLESEGDLAVAGAYTITGTGHIGLAGTFADITSDGIAAATLTNESTINAPFSGQIGDQGIFGVNDLTFHNYGSVHASGSGVTLTLNTGGNLIDDGGGMLVAVSGATLAIDSNVDTGELSFTIPPAPGGTIKAGVGGTVVLNAAVARGTPILGSVSGQVVIAGGTFDMLAGASVTVPIEFTAGGKLNISGTSTAVSVSGSNGAITAASGDTVSLTSGTADVISGSGFTVSAGSGVAFTVKGTGDVVKVGLNDAITDKGASTEFQIASNVGAFKISDFGSDPTGLVDLVGGVGGYTSGSQAYDALTSDGSGGSLLSLAATSDGSIDFLGVAPSALHATNFTT